MGFNLEDHIPVVVKLDNTGVIFEYRQAPVIVPQTCPDIGCGSADAAVKQVIGLLSGTGVHILIDDIAGENFMFAML